MRFDKNDQHSTWTTLGFLGLAELLKYMTQILMVMCGDQSGKFVCGWRVLIKGYQANTRLWKENLAGLCSFHAKHPALKFQHMCNQIWQSIKSLRLSYCSCRDGCCMIYPSHVSLIAWRCSWLPLADKIPMTKSYVGRADNLPWSIQKTSLFYYRPRISPTENICQKGLLQIRSWGRVGWKTH